MLRTKKNWLGFLFFMVLGCYFYWFSPDKEPFLFLSCPFYQISGYQCPGCGSQRAFHYILHLRFFDAIQQNVIFVMAIPYFILLFITSYNRDKYYKIRKFLLGGKTMLFILIVIILFGILRNL